MARGRALTDTQVRQVEQLVAAGVAQELAARVVGCSRRSVSRVLLAGLSATAS